MSEGGQAVRTRGSVRIRLLVDVAANPTAATPVVGRRGDELEVPAAVAKVWCDGIRAERTESAKAD